MNQTAAPGTANAPNSREPERPGRAQRPRLAATLILLDRTGAVPKVLLGLRHASHVFMPSKFVFPGGRIEACDRRMVAAGALPAQVEARLLQRPGRVSAALPRHLALAAIRETFEETGLLIGTRDFGPPAPTPPGAWTTFASHGVFPTLDGFHLIARAITPPGRSRRFDAAFFAVDAKEIAGQAPGIVGPDAELTEIVWAGLDEALSLDLPRITKLVLGDLKARLAGEMSHFLPMPFYGQRRGVFSRLEIL